MTDRQSIPEISEEQRIELSELIYGYLSEKAGFSEAILPQVSVNISFNTIENLAQSASSDKVLLKADVPVTLAALNCVQGNGRGCWPGFRLA